MKLEIKHLAHYLPYELKGIETTDNTTISLEEYIDYSCQVQEVDLTRITYEFFKPILRQLSDLTKEIEVNGERFVPMVKIGLQDSVHHYSTFIKNQYGYEYDVTKLGYNKVSLLLEWHFDVFGLIDKGLAIDINTITANH